MGLVRETLIKIELPSREAHNSRMFVDLCENVHIHYRELRIVFSIDEFFEFADILHRSSEDLRSYLAQNPDYQEGVHRDTIMIAGGQRRQRALLRNSPAPNRSTYFPGDFAIELLDESMTDEMHVHWRDYRFAIPREHFKLIAEAFAAAKRNLEAFEAKNEYVRKPHRDRTIEDYASEKAKYGDYKSLIAGEVEIPINQIRTRFDDDSKEFRPEPQAIRLLEQKYRSGEYIHPVILSTERTGEHYIIDGNHRLLAAKNAGCSTINCIVTDLTFEQSADFRRAEALLKRFDRDTGYAYRTSDFNRAYFAHRASRHYRNHFRDVLGRARVMGRVKRFLRPIKRMVRTWALGREAR
jgi:hypothetical protein